MILIGTTLAAFVMDQRDTWEAWLRNVEAIRHRAAFDAAHDVEIFAAIETDARGMAPFRPLTDRLLEVGGKWWEFKLDDGRTEVTTGNRLRHITAGQNLVTDQAVASRADWLLFMAADTMAPDDIVPRMLEMDWPFVAPFIPTYGLRGEPVKDAGYDFPAEYAMPSAACVFIGSDVFRRVRWRWDYEDGSDDPCYWRDAREHLGIRARVRMDCTARHFPEAIGPVETRGHDMSVHR